MSELLEQTIPLDEQQPLQADNELCNFTDRVRNVAHMALESVRGHGRELAAVACGALAMSGGVAEASQTQQQLSKAFTYQEYVDKKTNYDEIGAKVKAFQMSVSPNTSDHQPFYNSLDSDPRALESLCATDVYGKISYSLKKNTLKLTVERADKLIIKPAAYRNGDAPAPITDGSNPFENPAPSRGPAANFEYKCSDLVDISSSMELWKSRLKKSKNIGDNHTKVSEVKGKQLPPLQSQYKTGPEGTNVNVPPSTQVDVITMKVPASVAALARQKKLFPTAKISINSKISLYKDKINLVLRPVNAKGLVTTKASVDDVTSGKPNSPVALYNNKNYPKFMNFDSYLKYRTK